MAHSFKMSILNLRLKILPTLTRQNLFCRVLTALPWIMEFLFIPTGSQSFPASVRVCLSAPRRRSLCGRKEHHPLTEKVSCRCGNVQLRRGFLSKNTTHINSFCRTRLCMCLKPPPPKKPKEKNNCHCFDVLFSLPSTWRQCRYICLVRDSN